MKAKVCEEDSVLAMTWIDNEAERMLSTVNEVGSDHCTERTRHRPRLTSTNFSRVRVVFWEHPTLT